MKSLLKQAIHGKKDNNCLEKSKKCYIFFKRIHPCVWPPKQKIKKFDGSCFFVKSQRAVLNFWYLTIFLDENRLWFFCQIVMGRPLNDNVPDGRSVLWLSGWEQFMHRFAKFVPIRKNYISNLKKAISCLFLKAGPFKGPILTTNRILSLSIDTCFVLKGLISVAQKIE